jgi:hypothetical protein
MSKLRNLVTVGCLAALFGCESLGYQNDSGGGNLVVITANAKAGLEARYTEAGHTIVLRSQPLGDALQSDLLDRDLSINARAREVVQKAAAFRTAGGKPVVAVKERFADAVRFTWALRLTRHALRQLHEVLPKEMAEGPHLGALEKEIAPIREALAKTKLVLLEEWASESRRHFQLGPEEHARFFAIFNQRAHKLAASGNAARGTLRARTSNREVGAVATAQSTGDEMQALLGAERYQKYLALHKSWISDHSGDGAEVTP